MALTERDRACFGPRNQKVVGSIAWCWQTLDLLKNRWSRKDVIDQSWKEIFAEVRQHAVWKVVPPEQPYGTLDALLQAEIGRTATEVQTLLAEAQPKEGRRPKLGNLPSLTQAERAQTNGISLRSQKKVDYLKDQRADLLAAVQAGTLSIDKAYRLASGKLPETPVDAATRALARLTEAEQRQVVRALPGSDRQAQAQAQSQAPPGLQPRQNGQDAWAEGYDVGLKEGKEQGYEEGSDDAQAELAQAGHQVLSETLLMYLADRGEPVTPGLLDKALGHFLDCPHRDASPVRLTGAELRAATDPFQALREEFARNYEREVRADLKDLIALSGCTRSTYAPHILAMHAKRLDKYLGAILKLLAPGKRHETLDRWQEHETPPDAE
jgi:hypothetical protein